MPHPKSQLYPQLDHTVSCGWWRGDSRSMWRHPSTNHNSPYGQIMGKIVILSVTPKFFSELLAKKKKLQTSNLSLEKKHKNISWDGCRHRPKVFLFSFSDPTQSLSLFAAVMEIESYSESDIKGRWHVSKYVRLKLRVTILQ